MSEAEYELIPIGPCQRDGCGLGRGAGIHSGQERDYHGYQPALRATPEAEAAIEGLERALRLTVIPHYGEPVGLKNCPRNHWSGPATDEEIARQNRETGTTGATEVCDCGADEANARIREALDRARLAGLTKE